MPDSQRHGEALAEAWSTVNALTTSELHVLAYLGRRLVTERVERGEWVHPFSPEIGEVLFTPAIVWMREHGRGGDVTTGTTRGALCGLCRGEAFYLDDEGEKRACPECENLGVVPKGTP